jgi:adenylate cyclase class 2
LARETEIKMKVDDLGAFRRRLKRLGAKTVGFGTGRVREENVIFDTPEGGLAKHGQLLRFRTETCGEGKTAGSKGKTGRVVVTFKRPLQGQTEQTGFGEKRGRYKVREEIELEVAEPEPLAKIFEGLGMRPWFRYEKYRTTFRLPAKKAWARGLLIELDETPIGTFVELEGPAEGIDRAAQELGYSRRDYILKNYLVLYLEECRRKGIEPQDMVFSKQNSKSK